MNTHLDPATTILGTYTKEIIVNLRKNVTKVMFIGHQRIGSKPNVQKVGEKSKNSTESDIFKFMYLLSFIIYLYNLKRYTVRG